MSFSLMDFIIVFDQENDNLDKQIEKFNYPVDKY